MTAPSIYQEARLNIEPTTLSPSSVLSIHTSKSSAYTAGRKRSFGEISGLDEESYARKHLASEASVFFRRKSRSPRSFSWRVLDDRQVLEIQCVDLVQERKQAQESYLTFAVAFSSAIAPYGVAFADPEDHDALEAFVLTTSHELYTITLRRDLLTRETPPADFDSAACFKKYHSTALSFRRPYRLVAISARELLISLNDGGLMRLDREAGNSGLHWRETFYSEGGWGTSLRGLIGFRQHNTVQYGDMSLEPGCAAAIAISPDACHVWTVSLDHTLKAWNTKTGKVGIQIDLHGERRGESRNVQTKYLMSATQGTLMRVLPVPTGTSDAVARLSAISPYIIVTHSPKDHQFKFWSIVDADSLEGGIQDMLPQEKLLPPIDQLLNSNVWHLEEFFVKRGAESTNMQIWLRARSGALCRVFHLDFDMDDLSNIAETWQTGWTVVSSGPQTSERLKDCSGYPGDLDPYTIAAGPTTPSERWLDFFLYPGRFSIASIETALHMYKNGRGIAAAGRLNSERDSLKTRITTAVSSKIVMRRLAGEQPDFERYQHDVQAQWLILYGLVKHLHQRRGESVALAFDEEDELAWSVLADYVCPIRKSSDLEILLRNQALLETDTSMASERIKSKLVRKDEAIWVAQLLKAASALRLSLADSINDSFVNLVTTEILRVPDENPISRLQDLYSRSGIASEITDDDFESLTNAMEELGGLNVIDNDGILAVIELIQETQTGVDKQLTLTRYGDKLNIGGAQETLQLGHEVLLDLLLLVLFMAADLEPEELSSKFEAGELYDILIYNIKQHDLLLWLARNVRQEPLKARRRASVQLEEARAASGIPPRIITLTVYESIFIGDWRSVIAEGSRMPELVTHWIRDWTYGSDLYQSWDGVTAHIFANLIKHKDLDLATQFLRYTTTDAWVTYLKGRLQLATGHYTLAALEFRQAAEDLSQRMNGDADRRNFDSAGLLSATDRNLLTDGQFRYYQHISSLFETFKVYSYTADFAAVALEHLNREEGFDHASLMEIDQKKSSMQGSPATDRIGLAMNEIRLLRLQEVREELLGRLFNALVQTGRFPDAYDAVSKLNNPALRKASLQTLLQLMVTHEATSTLMELPFSTEMAVDADAILLSLARKTLTNTTSASQPLYVRILYAWRMQRVNFRGAAEILHQWLEHLRHVTKAMQDPEDDTLLNAYTLLINTLACCNEDEGWLLAEPVAGLADGNAKRKLVTLADVRREYSAELDKRSEILQGRFALVGDEMDVL